MVILDMPMPKDCLWYEDGKEERCPFLDDGDYCRGQSDEANEAAETWDELRKGCPIKGELVQCGECRYDEDCSHHMFVHPNGRRKWFCADGKRKEKESKNIKSSLEYDYCGTPKLRYDIEARKRGEHDE